MNIMRNSRQRDLILHIVQGTNTHPSADWIYDEARQKMPSISLGTVYRNLGQLVENNLLITINMDGTVRYDALLSAHQHFRCSTCNKIFDIEIDTQDFVSQIETKTNHKIDGHQIHLIGICEDCKNN